MSPARAPRPPVARTRPPQTARARRLPPAGAAAAVAAGLALGGCTGEASPERTPELTAPTTSAPPTPPATDLPASTPTPAPATPSATGDWPAAPVVPAATTTPTDVVTGLTTPWGLAFLPGGAVLVTLRDPAQVALVAAGGVSLLAGPGAEQLAATTSSGGEGGLLGITVSPTVDADRLVYLYRTTDAGNEVVRAALDPAASTLGPLEPVLGGIPAAGNHNGGRIAFGPDGHLYVTTGDAGDRPSAQDPASLAGKILRVTADGAPAPGNPIPGSPVWSLGHRNVQGLAWDAAGTLFASEFGQDTLDELNVIAPGGNYGWPAVEGAAGEPGLIDPVAQWPPDDASPSGVATAGGTVYVAGLRGQRLLTVPFPAGGQGAPGEPGAALVGELGRLRHVAVGPDGALWLLTHNTDGRGDPRPGDDRLVRVLAP